MTTELLRTTTSICPECMKAIEAQIVVDRSKGEEGWVMMYKTCAEHGDFQDIISKNPELYSWKHSIKNKLDSEWLTIPTAGNQFPVSKGCPFDCGLCNKHLSSPNLSIIDITNRCNLNCPICFANSNASGRIVEYSYEEVVRIMEFFINLKPNPPAIMQFSGGEPTLHPRIIDLIKKAKELGFQHRMINTNGIRMARSLEFCKQLKEADCGAIYLSFDAISKNSAEVYKKIRGMDLTKIKQKVIDNVRKSGLSGIMLVVTVSKDINDKEIGPIMEFAKENNDVIAGVIFQPVSLCGRIPTEDLMKMRYTSSDLTKELTRVTNGTMDKFYPLAMTSKLTQLLIWFSNLPRWSMSAHEDCGWATFAPIKDGQFIPLSEYIDVEGFTKWANECWDMISKRQIPKPSEMFQGLNSFVEKIGISRFANALGAFTDSMSDIAYRNAMKVYFLSGMVKYINNFEPKKIFEDDIYKYALKFINDIRIEKSRDMLQHGLLMVGCMHFQDVYDLDVERVKRCIVHYGALNPDDPQQVLQIPFCTFNSIHREPIEKKWAEKFGKSMKKSTNDLVDEVEAFEKSI